VTERAAQLRMIAYFDPRMEEYGGRGVGFGCDAAGSEDGEPAEV